jgi:superfamily II DNA or RNA helicase
MLIVVAAPYLPLVAQWAREAERFGLSPVVPGAASDRAGKLAAVQRGVRALRIGSSEAQCLVVTHDFLSDPDLAAELARLRSPAMLIADEAHNLGTARFLAAAPDVFGYRLALSATPVRQYDPTGTAGLLAYFGDVVFQFTLADAIGRCLVPYYYHLHEVPLSETELEEWMALTSKLRASGWHRAADNIGGALPQHVQRLLSGRRRVIEQAENKLDVFDRELSKIDRRALKHTLVYASDKGRAQLSTVNALLMDRHGLRVHQLTQEETSEPGRAARILSDFSRGDGIQVLTAMRVLDEGVDIPEVSTAHILASTTVERQWVQRRGRVLRKCSRIGKETATIHDYIVVPPATSGIAAPPEIAGLLRGELERAREFATLSLNAGAEDGPLRTIADITHQYF